jgi:heme exporter protein D
VGWFGVFLFAGSLLALIVLYVHGVLARKAVQKP